MAPVEVDSLLNSTSSASEVLVPDGHITGTLRTTLVMSRRVAPRICALVGVKEAASEGPAQLSEAMPLESTLFSFQLVPSVTNVHTKDEIAR